MRTDDVVQAAKDGNREILSRLIAADPTIVDARTASGQTPLHAALAAGHVETALLLIEAGADVSVTDAGGHTPFHIAAEKGLVPVVKALLARGADAHAVDAEDRTPLSRAVTRGHTEIIDLINVRE
jgi:ankyrin repeat protein